MIWELALPARTVIIDHNLTVATRSCIKEEVPALLSVNREARQCAEEKLTSVFQAPRLSWEYNGSLKSAELRKVLKKLGLPQRGTITIMLQTISKFMNTGDPDTTGFNRFAKYTDTSKDLAYPQWLDPKTDMLIFRFPVNDAATERISISKSLLWTPSKGNESLKIRHIAFSVDALTTHARHYEGQRVWSKLSGRSGLRDGRFLTPRKASLESVAIVISDACEVLSFRVDSKSLLKPGEWAFKLDTDNDEFKEELGARWASATWKITLAKKDDWNLMRLIREVRMIPAPVTIIFPNVPSVEAGNQSLGTGQTRDLLR